MSNRRATVTQSDLTKVLKAFRDAGFAAPVLVIEGARITARPANITGETGATGWEDCE